MDIVTNRLMRQSLPLFNVLAAVLLILGIGAIFYFGKEVLVQLSLALLLSFALSPVVTFLRGKQVSGGLAVSLAVLLALAVIMAIGWVGYRQGNLLATDIPGYEPVIRSKLTTVTESLASESNFSRAKGVLTGIFTDLHLIENADKAGSAANGPSVVRLDAERSGLEALLHYLSPVLHPLATLLVVLMLAGFMLAQREDLRNRFIRLAGTDDIQKTTEAIDDAANRVGRMLLTQLAVNAAFGLVIGVGLWLIGLPSPFLWGIFAGILRFVPYIGAFIGLVPPLLVAFAADPSWWSLIWTVSLFVVLEPIVGHVLEPMLYGHSSGLSPVAVVVAALVWSFLWGPIGLVLATPLTICMVVLGRHVPRLAFLDILLGDRPVLAPHEMFYQRMLAGDPREAVGQALEFLKGRGLATYYDQIALEAMRRAHMDIVRGSLPRDRLATLVASSERLVSALNNVQQPLAIGGEASSEAEAAFEVIQQDQGAVNLLYQPQQLPAPWQVSRPIAVLYGNDALDRAAAAMLAQVFTKHGLTAEIAALNQDEAAFEKAIDACSPALICLSFIEPLSTLHLRAATRQARRQVKDAKVMIAVWQETSLTLRVELTHKARADAVVTRVSEALEAVRGFIHARNPA